jgi:RNA polymerase sigma-70 factor (ECF subfamily)
MLYAVCLRITGHPEDALDALQETLTRAWRSAGSFRGEARPSTWLYRIATNAALAEVSRRKARPDPVDEVPGDRWATVRAAGDVAVDRLSVDAALRRLPPPYRAAIVLRECCGCGYEEIVDILGVPMNTVKSRISRGRQALLELLGPGSVEGEGGAG